MQVPLHLCKAVAALLPIPFTFYIAEQLLHHNDDPRHNAASWCTL
jgi:hypothetical protein